MSLSSEHEHQPGAVASLVISFRGFGDGTVVGEEQELDRERKASVQANDHNEQHFADLAICRAEDGVKVAQKERDGHSQPHGNKDPVKDLDGGPADGGDRDPD